MIRTLIVEDEAIIRKSLHKLVTEAELGFEVIGEATNGVEGLELAANLQPDLIITDIRMPLMSGLDLIKHVKSKGSLAECIILSGYGEFKYAQEAIHYGVSDYLLKPIRQEQLIQTLHKVKAVFEKKKMDWNEYSIWLQYCAEEGKKVAHFIWDVQENEAKQALHTFHNDWLVNSSDHTQYKSRSIELFSRIHSLLAHQFGQKSLDYNKQMIQEANSIQEVQNMNKFYISIWLQAIRETRNYGSFQHIKQVLVFIESNYMNNELSLQMAADHIKWSVPYVSQVFKQSVGISFSQYLIQLRMEKAKQLLADPDCKTADIPEHIGYTDYPHFTKTFKKMYGISPREYRKSMHLPYKNTSRIRNDMYKNMNHT